MGKFIRHGIGALVGGALGALTAALAGQGIEVDPGAVAETTSALTNALTLAVTIFGYAAVEKFLKRFKGLDTEGWIDRIWLKKEAQVAESNPLYSPKV